MHLFFLKKGDENERDNFGLSESGRGGVEVEGRLYY